MALSGRLAVSARLDHTNPLDLGSAILPLEFVKAIDIASGVGANQADRLYSKTHTTAASGTTTLDLAGGLTDAFGATLTLAKIKALLLHARSTNTNNVVITRPATNGVPIFSAAGDSCPVLPGGSFCWWAPNAAAIAVTAGTGDLIDVVNSAAGTSVTWDVVILGTSA